MKGGVFVRVVTLLWERRQEWIAGVIEQAIEDDPKGIEVNIFGVALFPQINLRSQKIGRSL